MKTHNKLFAVAMILFFAAAALITGVETLGKADNVSAESEVERCFRLTGASKDSFTLEELETSGGAVKLTLKSNVNLDEVNSLLKTVSETSELLLGDGTNALNLYDNTLSLESGVFYLKGIATGSAQMMKPIIDFKGLTLFYGASLTNSGNNGSGFALRNGGEGTLNLQSGSINGGVGVAVYALSGKTIAEEAVSIISKNALEEFGTVKVAGNAEFILNGATVQNSSSAITARVINTGMGSDYKITVKNGVLRFSNSLGTAHYSSAQGITVNNAGDGLFTMENGTILSGADVSVGVNNASDGKIEIKGGLIDAKKGTAIANLASGEVVVSQVNSEINTKITSAHEFTGTINSSSIGDSSVVISGGTVINTAKPSAVDVGNGIENKFVISKSYAVYAETNMKCDITVSGGTITLSDNPIEPCEKNAGIYFGSKGTLRVNGGKIEVDRGYAIHSAKNGNTVAIVGGEVINTGDVALFNEFNGTVSVSGGKISGAKTAFLCDSEQGKIILNNSPQIMGNIDIQETFGMEFGDNYTPSTENLSLVIGDSFNAQCTIKNGAKYSESISVSTTKGKLIEVDGSLVFVVKITLTSSTDGSYQKIVYATADGKYPELPDAVEGTSYWKYEGTTVKQGDELAVNTPHKLTLSVLEPTSEVKKGCKGAITGSAAMSFLIFITAISAVMILEKNKEKRKGEQK